MRDHDRPDVETAILDHLVGRQIESRPWTASPEDGDVAGVPDATPTDDADTDPDGFVIDAAVTKPLLRREQRRVTACEPDDDVDRWEGTVPPEEPTEVDEPATVRTGFDAPLDEAIVTSEATPIAPDPVTPAAVIAGVPPAEPTVVSSDASTDGVAEALADAESIALRSLLSECATLLQWVCGKAEQGTLRQGDVARARAFLAMSGLPPTTGRVDS